MYDFVFSFFSDFNKQFNVGDNVAILYNPENPTEAKGEKENTRLLIFCSIMIAVDA